MSVDAPACEDASQLTILTGASCLLLGRAV